MLPIILIMFSFLENGKTVLKNQIIDSRGKNMIEQKLMN